MRVRNDRHHANLTSLVSEKIRDVEVSRWVDDPGFRAALEAWLRDGVRLWFGDRILSVDETVIMAWRRLAAGGQRAGYTYSQPDALIAATALVHELCVVTRNTADFMRAGVMLLNPWATMP